MHGYVPELLISTFRSWNRQPTTRRDKLDCGFFLAAVDDKR